MKIAPVLEALDRRGATTLFVHTGQHYDAVMSDVFLDELDIRRPDRALGVGSDSHAQQTARLMQAFEPVVLDWRPDIVVVVGDVNSTLACALVASKLGVAIGHVEAGLRSNDWSMPEEINRVLTDRLSDLLFAPTEDARPNLLAEGIPPERIHVVGNVMVDALLHNLPRARERPILDLLGLQKENFGLVTLHRPSNVDDDAVFAGIARALEDVSAALPLVFPVHPRTQKRLAEHDLAGDVRLLEPTGYLDTIALLDAARIVLTDSGGIQEETTVLGVPCVTVRENTERPVTVDRGTNRIAGTDPDKIVKLAHEAMGESRNPTDLPLWDGHAADRIADVLLA